MWPAVLAAGIAIDLSTHQPLIAAIGVGIGLAGGAALERVDSRVAPLGSGLRPRQRCAAVHFRRGRRHGACAGVGLSRLLSRVRRRRSPPKAQPGQLDPLVDQHRRGRASWSARYWWPSAGAALRNSSGIGSRARCGCWRWRSAAWEFCLAPSNPISTPPMALFAILLVVVGAIRFGLVPAAGASFVISVLAALGIAFSRGIFAHIDELHGLGYDLDAERRAHRPDAHRHRAARGAGCGEPREAARRAALCADIQRQPSADLGARPRHLEVSDDQRGGGAPVRLEPAGNPVDDRRGADSARGESAAHALRR